MPSSFMVIRFAVIRPGAPARSGRHSRQLNDSTANDNRMARDARMTSSTMRRAFTLIELLLVLAIIAVVTAVTLPSFVRSIRGNRLRAAAGQIVHAGRYARTMAVMRQREMQLVLNLKSGIIRVTEGSAPLPDEEEPEDEEARRNAAQNSMGAEDEEREESPPPPSGPMDVSVQRKLDKVRIQSVEIEGIDDVFTDGQCSITYRSNGTCRPYEVKIVDEFDAAVTITVDALSGAETEQDELPE